MFLFLAFVTGPASAETLEALEAITARYATLHEFLSDPRGVEEYRKAYRLYLDDDQSFDVVFDEFIAQLKDVAENVPGFAEKSWKPNPDWRSQRYAVRGELTGSGLRARREALLNAIEQVKTEANDQAAILLDKTGDARTAKIDDLVIQLKSKFGIKSPSEVARLSRKGQAAYSSGLAKLSGSPLVQRLSAYVVTELLHRDESLSDLLYSGDADLIVAELKKLEKPVHFKAALDRLGISIPPEVLGYLKFSSPTHESILKSYTGGLKRIHEFQHIPDAKMSPQLYLEWQRLIAEGVPPDSRRTRLSPAGREAYRRYENEVQLARDRKRQFETDHNQRNSFFIFEAQEDPVRKTRRLKTQGGLELQFVPSPRPFHGFLAGRKTNECVGGRNCENFTPRRWARAALDGARTIFTENGDGKMEGFVGLTPMVRQSDGALFEVVDLMSRAMKGDVVIRGHRGHPVKYSFFDRFTELQPPLENSQGLIISDGQSVKANTGGWEVVKDSSAYGENHLLGKPEDFRLSDPMAVAIESRYSEGAYPGKMIYDGMKGDGSRLVKLVPQSQRRSWTKDELEVQVLEELVARGDVTDKSMIWRRALENEVPLQRVATYKEKLAKGLNDPDQIIAYLNDSHFPSFPLFLSKELEGGRLNTDLPLQNRLVDYLVSRPGNGEIAKNLFPLAGRVGASKLSEGNEEKLRSILPWAYEEISDRGLLVANVFGLHHPQWKHSFSIAEKWLAKLETADLAGARRLKLLVDGWIREVSRNRNLAGERVEALAKFMEHWNSFRKKLPPNTAEELTWMDGRSSGDSQMQVLSRLFTQRELEASEARALLRLDFEGFAHDLYRLRMQTVRLLLTDPSLIDDLIDHVIKRQDYSLLVEMGDWLRKNENNVDPDKAKPVKDLTTRYIGVYRSVLRSLDYYVLSAGGFYTAPWYATPTDNWDRSTENQVEQVKRNRLDELEKRWNELKHSVPAHRQIARKTKDGCSRFLNALGRLAKDFRERLRTQ